MIDERLKDLDILLTDHHLDKKKSYFPYNEGKCISSYSLFILQVTNFGIDRMFCLVVVLYPLPMLGIAKYKF